MSTSLVTGGAGFLGSHLVEALLATGERVIVLDDLSTGSLDNLARTASHPSLRIVEGSIADHALVSRLVAESDDVYHLAAAVGVKLVVDDPVRTATTNFGPTEHLLRILAGTKKRIFFASTSEVYGKNPKSPLSEEDDLVLGPTSKWRWIYACGKAMDEYLALGYHGRSGLRVIVGRFFNIVGPRQTGRYGMVVPSFIDQALAGQPLVVHGDGQQVRCFGHVSDAIRATLALMNHPAAEGKVFNIGSDKPISIRGLAELVQQEVNPQVPIEQVPYDAVFGAGFEDIRQRVPDLTKIHQAVGYRPRYSVAEIVRDVTDWKRVNAKK
ncbi:MAG: NAD-dependent epimerase/dehydratase family protein [Gemmataceae bacterium]